MSIKLDDLQIDIVVNATKAEKAIDGLTSSLKSAGKGSTLGQVASEAKNLGNATARARTEVRTLGDASKDAGVQAKDLSKSVKEAGKSASSAGSGFRSLFSDIVRIAKYRAIRSAIKAITNSFKEGIQALVEWDAAFGNNTSGALATMTEIKSLGLQITRTLGAMAMPIIQLFLPVIRLASKALMFLANLINQVVRGLQGYSTYMKATYVETDYLGDSIGRATTKAEELQRVLFGFDELNVLPSEDRYGGSGGTGVLGNVLPENYTETEIASPIKSIIDDIKYWLGDLFTAKFWQDIWKDIDYWIIQPVKKVFTKQFWQDIWQDILKAIHWEDIKSGITGAFEGAKKWIEEKKIAIKTTIDDLKTKVKEKWDALTKWWSDLKLKVAFNIEDIKTKVKEKWDNLKKWWDGLKLKVSYNIEDIKSKVSEKWNAAKQWLADKSLSIKNTVADIKANVATKWNDAKTWLSGQVLTAKTKVEEFKAKVSAAWTTAKTWVNQQILTAKTKVDEFKAKVSNAWTAAKNWLATQTLSAKTTVEDIKSKVSTAWNNAKTWLAKTNLSVKAEVTGFLNDPVGWIKGKWNSFKTWWSTNVSGWFQGKTNALAETLDAIVEFVTHPLTWFDGSGWETMTSKIQKAWSGGLDGAQDYADKHPLTAKTNVITRTIADQLAYAYGVLQDRLNRSPLEMNTKVTVGDAPGVSSSIISQRKNLIMQAYASGGTIPYNTGSLFVAGERGAEVVANMGNSTGVMNVNQMQEAVANGNIEVINAIYGMANMIVNAVNNKDLDIYMDSAKVGKSVTQYQSNQMRRGVAY